MYKRILLIDGNNLYNRGYHIAKHSNKDIFDFILKMIFNLKVEYIDARMVFFFDTCKSEMKTKLFPEYKENRKNRMDPDEYEFFKRKLNEIIALLKNSKLIVIDGEGYEADDYIACMCKMLKAVYKITIVSTDRDLCQLINDNVRQLEPVKDIKITEDNFKAVLGVEKKHFLDYKCMLGDSSDGIPGIDGVGEITAKKLVELYGPFENIFAELSKKEKLQKKEQNILQSKELIERNKKLMDLTIYFYDTKCKEIVLKKSKELQYNEEEIFDILARNNCSEYFQQVKELCLTKSSEQ